MVDHHTSKLDIQGFTEGTLTNNYPWLLMELLALKSNLMLNLGKFDTFFNLKIKGVHV
jgi:hypothetical protein